MEFEKFPKIPRLNRGIVITEKIDGTNACVVIEDVTDQLNLRPIQKNWDGDQSGMPAPCAVVQTDSASLALYAQSRKRIITPGKKNDNMGFAGWVAEHAEELVRLGLGRHFGEWWGKGIQRGYGLEEKRFSLFNTGRWHDDREEDTIGQRCQVPACCHVVPVVAEWGSLDRDFVMLTLRELRNNGSHAAPGYDNPEGIVVYQPQSNYTFKVTAEYDLTGKGQ